jgi:hypothetical protein
MNSNALITHEEITRRAHAIWEQCGRLEGHELEHWLRAEHELRRERHQAAQFAQSHGGAAAKLRQRERV